MEDTPSSEPAEVEPPDLARIRSLHYELNGGSEFFRPIRYGEARDGNTVYRKNLDSGVILRKTRDDAYECIVHNIPATRVVVSRDVILNVRPLDGQNHVKCEPAHYCSKCGEAGPPQRMPTIHERDLTQHTT